MLYEQHLSSIQFEKSVLYLDDIKLNLDIIKIMKNLDIIKIQLIGERQSVFGLKT